MKFKIEDQVPIPPKKGGPRNPMVEALKIMKDGQSFVIPIKKFGYIWKISKNIGIKIVSRKISDCELRVWKVKKDTNCDAENVGF